MSYRIPRRAYAETYGPTTGDRLRLADTELILEVEHDHTVYGDEVKFGCWVFFRWDRNCGQRSSN